jgi:hypothetical protein
MNLSEEEQAEIWDNINDPIKAKARFDDYYGSLGKSESPKKNKIDEIDEEIKNKVIQEYEKTENSMNPFSTAKKIRDAANKNIAPNFLIRQVGKFVNSREAKKKIDLNYISLNINHKNYSDFIGQNEEIDKAISEVFNPLTKYNKNGGKAKRKTRRVKRKTGRKSKSSKKNKNKKTKKQNKTRKVKQSKKKGKK